MKNLFECFVSLKDWNGVTNKIRPWSIVMGLPVCPFWPCFSLIFLLLFWSCRCFGCDGHMWELGRTETASSGCEGEMAVDFSGTSSSSVSLPFSATQLMEFGLLLYFNANYTLDLYCQMLVIPEWQQVPPDEQSNSLERRGLDQLKILAQWATDSLCRRKVVKSTQSRWSPSRVINLGGWLWSGLSRTQLICLT